MPDQRQPEQARVGQQALDDPGLVHPQVAEPGVPMGATGRVEQRGRSEAFDEPPQLAGRDRPLAKIDERGRGTALLEEPDCGAGVLVAFETEDLDRGPGG